MTDVRTVTRAAHSTAAGDNRSSGAAFRRALRAMKLSATIVTTGGPVSRIRPARVTYPGQRRVASGGATVSGSAMF